MTLTIALIYPELLGTYGDRGNALVLNHRAKQRGIDSKVITVAPDETFPTSADIYLLGGGEDSAQTLATQMLQKQLTKFQQAIETSQLIAICAGFQIIGNQFPVSNDNVHDGLGIIDVTTTAGSPRIIGEVVTQSAINEVGKLTGFENHGGRTTLAAEANSLGKVLVGTGNGINTSAGLVDGYLSKNIIGTYLHGPLFARNPLLADYVLARAQNITMSDLKPIENDSSVALHEERLLAAGIN